MECKGCGEWELQSVGAVKCRSCGVRALQSAGVVECKSLGLQESFSVGVTGSFGVNDFARHYTQMDSETDGHTKL